MTRVAVAVVALGLWLCPGAARAGPTARSFAELPQRLDAGDSIFVIDRGGREMAGTLLRLSPDSLVIQVGREEQEFRSDEIGRIEMSGDPVWDGAVKGVLLSAPYWALGGAASCHRERGVGCPIAAAGALTVPWAIIGAYADWRQKGRAIVYAAPGVSASAPSSIDELWTRVKSGDRVSVRDVTGRDTEGTFLEVAESSLALLVDGQRREIPGADVRRVARRGDSAWGGFVIGAAAGGIMAAARSDGEERLPLTLLAAYFYGAVGAGIDSLIPGRTVVYRAPGHRAVRVTPLIGRARAGVMVSAQF